MQEPRIIEIPTKRLIGMSLEMSLSDNQTYVLWSQFMPRRKEIKKIVNANLYLAQELRLNTVDFHSINWRAVAAYVF